MFPFRRRGFRISPKETGSVRFLSPVSQKRKGEDRNQVRAALFYAGERREAHAGSREAAEGAAFAPL